MIEMIMKTGLRVSELVDLMLGDVELSEREGRVIVREGKGSKYREVPLSKEVRVALAMYLQKRSEDDSRRMFLWIVSRLASGISTATKSTLLSSKLEIKAKLRARRSRRAIMSVALCFLQVSKAACNCGRLFLVLSISVNSLAE